MKRKLSVTAALAFIAAFIGIIIIADRGEGNNWWSFINRIPAGDKVGHVCLVGMLSMLCNLAFHPEKPAFLPRFITHTTFILLALLSAEEIAQAFLPHRTCDFFDWLADLAGLALGQFAAGRLYRRFFA